MSKSCLPRSGAAMLILCLLPLVACKRSDAPAPAAVETPAATIPAAAVEDKAQASDAFLVLPGDYAEHTTLADLEARFGKSNIRVGPAPDRSVVLFPDDPTRRAYVRFYDEETLLHMAGIQVNDAGSRWRGKKGVQIGMSFSQLRQINGKPFYYGGLDQQKRAWVHDSWSPALDDNDSTLGKLDVEEGDRLYFEVQFGLRTDAAAYSSKDYPADEASISSDDPRYPRLGELLIITGISANSSLDDEWS